MGPYCKFCGNRCFVPFPIGTPENILKAYGTSTIVATCKDGQKYEEEKTGYCYNTIIMAIDGNFCFDKSEIKQPDQPDQPKEEKKPDYLTASKDSYRHMNLNNSSHYQEANTAALIFIGEQLERIADRLDIMERLADRTTWGGTR